ncbi:putative immunity protein [Cellulomonas sp.]|uniref:putative immunity protein n=1 Tax=Cellulomonas sp. TaxID=40001 RepID=UPI002D2900BE|nr:exonuclease SbcC [Cellulomonas sp.]HYQ73877.1 exonuclease SbcC [Cellulomonas sp.]
MMTGDVHLTMTERRAVVRFAVDCAQGVLPEFEAVAPEDARPREAIAAALAFADGADRSNLQRTAAFAAHRAARDVATEPAQLAALACGDASAAAYLHPIARATQVGHILRAAACAARVAEVRTSAAGDEVVRALAERAAPPVPEVLARYPAAPRGRTRLSELVCALDAAIRDGR